MTSKAEKGDITPPPALEAGGADELEIKTQPAATYADMPCDRNEEDFMTRNGLSLKSFQKRSYGQSIVELDRTMKKRHLQMISIGGSIGAGFFVGSGGALAKGGPATLLIDFAIIGIMMFNVGMFFQTQK